MPTIHSLPIELLRPILEKAADENYFNRNLALLSICQTWREIVARRAYSTVNLYSSSTHKNGSVTLKGYYYDNMCTPILKASSNFQLVKANGMLDMVTQLKINDRLSNNAPGLLVNVMNVIASGTNGLPHFDDMRRRYIACVNSDFTDTELDNALRHDAKELARYVASVLPNIKSLCFYGDQSHVYGSIFFANMVTAYETQLLFLECRAPEHFPKPVFAHQIKLLGISLYEAKEPLLLRIIPAPLERLNITAQDLSSCWRIFTKAPDGAVHFDNLKVLDFQYWHLRDWSVNVDQSQHKSENMLAVTVTAPKLEHVIINDRQFNPKGVEWLAKSPLQSLVFNGHAHNALQLCNLLNYPLRRFKLHSFTVGSASNGEFVQTINHLMSKMQCAKHVVCTFEGNAHLDLTDLNWPNLTQLNLCVPVDISVLVSKLPKMPALVLLELSLEVYYGDDATSAARFLKQLRDIYSEPVQSCVEGFYLIAGNSYDDDENSALVECFMHVENDLKWLLPKLKALYINGY